MARHEGDPTGSGVSRGHRVFLAALLLTAVALVGLSTGFLLSLAENESDGTRARRTPSVDPSPSATAPASTLPRPTVRAASEVEPDRRKDLGYLLGARSGEEGLLHVAFDRVQLLRGDAAEAYARKNGEDPEAARRGLVVNENPRTRDMVLAPDVKVLGGVQLAASSDLEEVPLQKLLEALDEQGGSLPLELRFDKLGYVVEVREKRFG